MLYLSSFVFWWCIYANKELELDLTWNHRPIDSLFQKTPYTPCYFPYINPLVASQSWENSKNGTQVNLMWGRLNTQLSLWLGILGSFLITYLTYSLYWTTPLCKTTADFYVTTNYGNNAFHIDRYDCITITYLFWMNARVTSSTPLWCIARNIAHVRVR